MKTFKQVAKHFNLNKVSDNEYTLQTKVGTLQITDRNDLSFIPMMFQNDFNLDEFLKLSHDETINKHSYKWNLHSSDKQFNLSRLISRLEFFTKNN